MTWDMSFFENLVKSSVLRIHTAYIARVESVSDDKAVVAPLTYSKDVNGNLLEQAPVTAYVPQNVKFEEKEITYVTSVSGSLESGISTETETAAVFVPAELAQGDIVLCIVCERDITYAVQGRLSEPSRMHDMNDSVIIKVL